MRNRIFILGLWIAGSCVALLATLYSPSEVAQKNPIEFLQTESRWADSVLQNMSTSRKVAQLFVLVDSAKESEPDSSLFEILGKSQPGGILFRNFDVEKQYLRTRAAQRHSSLPLLIGVDRRSHDSRWVRVPEGLSLGAIEEEPLIAQLGQALAAQGHALGTHLIFTPSLSPYYDSQNRELLSQKEVTLHKHIHTERLLSSPAGIQAYFPQLFDSTEVRNKLLPYKKLVDTGTPAMLLEKNQLETIKTHFHKKGILTEYLKKEISYDGLLMVDISDVEETDKSESYLRKAVHVGSDLMIVNRQQLSFAYKIVLDMLSRGALSEADLDKHVRRGLLAKSWVQAPKDQELASEKDSLLLDDALIAQINQKIASAKLTLLENRDEVIPFTKLRDKRIHLSVIGENVPHLLKQLRSFGPVSNTDFRITQKSPWTPLSVRTLRTYNPVILSLSGELPNKAIDTAFISSVKKLSTQTEVILVNFSSIKALSLFPEIKNVLQVYETDSLTQVQTAQLLFGGIAAKGKFPVSTDQYAFQTGLSTEKTRLSYAKPEDVGIDSKYLSEIDSIVYEGIGSYAMPGCQVMVVKEGNIIFHESYGHHTYARRRGVFPTDIYDLASVTKIAATTLAAMHLTERGIMHPDQKLSRYFKDQIVIKDSITTLDTLFVGLDSIMRADTALLADLTPKEDSQSMFIKVWMGARREPWVDTLRLPGDSVILVKSAYAGKVKRKGSVFQARIGEMMTHTSGLPAGLPIRRYTSYQDTQLKVGKYDKYFQPQRDSLYTIQVAGGFFMRKDYLDSLWQDTKLIELDYHKRYEYSDANMVLLQQAIDSVNEEPLDSFVQRVFYERLGMQNTAFKPRGKFDDDRLIPTEYDTGWRGQLLRGYVHDQTAALMGGVAGNAGLFANAGDLAILFQMLLNEGEYGGERYFSPQTVRTFIRTQGGHRGFGFDKSPGGPYIIAESASPNSYGHTGFTGTCVWVDPDEELIYIFLSNRIHPKANNWKLNELRIRQRIHQVVYDALEGSRTSYVTMTP